MNIELREVTVRELTNGYSDDGQNGVRGYNGRLDIRPPFQREFVYNDKQRNAVIDSVLKGFPLNVMYWSDRGNHTFEIIDGQQRTISLAQYVQGDFPHNDLFFHNLPANVRESILNYKLMVYTCSGTESDKLDWFKIINIAGVKLTDQELRNAVYSGSWVSDAKRYFSSTGCVAYQIGHQYLKSTAKPIRQDYLETAIKWINQNSIDKYMANHQHDLDARELWDHYRSVIEWVESVFTVPRKAMKGIDWGKLHDEYKNVLVDTWSVEAETQRLIADDDVQKQSGIYAYILTRDVKHLNLRAFPNGMKQRVYEQQDGKCAMCGDSFDISAMEADHVTPWVEGGGTVETNCQMLCKSDNRTKGAR